MPQHKHPTILPCILAAFLEVGSGQARVTINSEPSVHMEATERNTNWSRQMDDSCDGHRYTLPETNSSHLKIGHPKRKLVTSIPTIHVQGRAVSFREGISIFTSLIKACSLWKLCFFTFVLPICGSVWCLRERVDPMDWNQNLNAYLCSNISRCFYDHRSIFTPSKNKQKNNEYESGVHDNFKKIRITKLRSTLRGSSFTSKKKLFLYAGFRCEVDFGVDVGLPCLGWKFILRLGSGWFSRYSQKKMAPVHLKIIENQRITSKLYSGVTPQFRNMIFAFAVQ